MSPTRFVFALSALPFIAAACASTSTSPPPPDQAPRFIEDDAAGAFAKAAASGKPLFVDTWATWCHSCLALKAEVLSDPSLARFSDHFVWLSLDVEKESAAPFLERYPQPAYPTLWVLRPDGTPLLRWVGTLTAPQLGELLTDALVAHSGAPAAPATAKLLAAESAAAEGRSEDAIAGYRAALELAPADWPRRARAANALMFLLSKDERHEECFALAQAEVPRAPEGAAGRPDLVIGGISCGAALPRSAERDRVIGELVRIARALAADDALLGDDRSGAWMAVVEGLGALDDQAGVAAANAAWAALLDRLRADAKTPAERAVYDTHVALAFVAVGRGPDALAALAQSGRDFPDDYNPPARTANVLIELGRFDEAKVAIERALSLVYGPRRLRLRSVEATIHEKLADRAGARAVLEAALAEADALPEAQRPKKLVETLKKRLAGLTP